MISKDEYEQILPHRQALCLFNLTGTWRGKDESLILADVIRQRQGMRPLSFTCSGCKAEALKDLYSFMVNYEDSLENKTP